MRYHGFKKYDTYETPECATFFWKGQGTHTYGYILNYYRPLWNYSQTLMGSKGNKIRILNENILSNSI